MYSFLLPYGEMQKFARLRASCYASNCWTSTKVLTSRCETVFPTTPSYEIFFYKTTRQIYIYTNFPSVPAAPCKSRTPCARPWESRTHEQRVRELLTMPGLQLSSAQLNSILKLSEKIPEKDLIIASAISGNHYDEMQSMFQNLHETVYPRIKNFQMVLFDLGLSPTQKNIVSLLCSIIDIRTSFIICFVSFQVILFSNYDLPMISVFDCIMQGNFPFKNNLCKCI